MAIAYRLNLFHGRSHGSLLLALYFHPARPSLGYAFSKRHANTYTMEHRVKHSPDEHGETPSLWNKVVGAVALVGTFLGVLIPLGGIVGYVFFGPNFDYQQSISLDDSNPFKVRFVFVNSGSTSAHKVIYRCWTQHTQITGWRFFAVSTFEVGMPHLAAEEVEPGEPVDAQCYNDVAATVLKSELRLQLTYRPSFVFWTKAKMFRFVFMRTSDGKTHWIPEPLKADPYPTAPDYYFYGPHVSGKASGNEQK